jgi:thiol:disulfide interchange protein DsbD
MTRLFSPARALLALLLTIVAGGAAWAVNPEDLLDPDKAFRFSARALDAAHVEVRYEIADGYYLYRDRLQFAAKPDSVKLGAPELPQGETHEDAFFGKTQIYRKEVKIRVPVAGGSAASSRFRLEVTSQGCADVGVCYIPHTQGANLRLASVSSSAAGTGAAAERPGGLSALLNGNGDGASAAAAPPSGAPVSDEQRFLGMLESDRIWAAMGAFFVAGLLLTFTPCVLPMIPILSGIIVGEGAKVTRSRALSLSLAYVLGMAVTYTLIGIGAALSGSLLSAALQNAWVLSAFAAIFVLLALSMFGFYELQLPARWHTRVTEASNRLKGGRLGAVVVMGILSAAIVSPCVAAPLAGALLYISQTRDAVLGGAALFAMAIGMGVPLVLVGVSGGAFLPKSGHWMRSVRRFFGVLLLGVAVWIVSPVITVPVQMLLWGALLIGSGVFLGALEGVPHTASGWPRLWKAVGIIALLAGAAQVLGALAGARDPLRPLSGMLATSQVEPAHARFERVASLAELEGRLKTAGRPVMLDFYADWCVSCKEMERFTFSDPAVQARLSQLALLQADVTANRPEDKALLQRFRLFGPPGIVFFDRTGREIEGLRVIGYQPSDKFLKTLEQLESR